MITQSPKKYQELTQLAKILPGPDPFKIFLSSINSTLEFMHSDWLPQVM